MTIQSNCHTSDREWKPERESLAATLARLGVEPPIFDRQTFVRVMNIAENHRNTSEEDPLRKVHWKGSTICPMLNNRNRKYHTAQFRSFGRNEFIAYKEPSRCQYCNKEFQRHHPALSTGSHAHP